MGEMILPCPFCGNTPPGVTEILAGKVWAIDCKNILHSAGAMSWVSVDDVIAQWNRRDTAQHERIVAGLEADARRLKFLADNKLCITPIEGGGWDVYRYDENCVESLVVTASTFTGAIDAAIAFLAQTAEG